MSIIAGEEAGVEVEAEETGEPAETVEHPRRVRAAQEWRDAGQRPLVQIEVEPRIAVTDRSHGVSLRGRK